ncbi:MAG: hypothetical protein U0168_22260 [Nannocystaceae bacterium]
MHERWLGLTLALRGCIVHFDVGGPSGGEGGTGSGASVTETTISTVTGFPTTETTAPSTSTDTGAFDPVALCGVTLEMTPDGGDYLCACEACEVSRSGLSPASGAALLAECECICMAAGCGGSNSGGIDGGTASTTDTTAGGSSTGGSSSTSATTATSDGGGTSTT